ncbi:MAG: DNA mismatch endonuclease Vsr [Acidobacteria bacterium]|jgi:DNA mismatch endonuclease, patch repair protein|nr:DNA mismatch endonuclease Vsr [Acidobacteriota bacterium]
MDTVDRQTRSRIMASVGQKDTGAELLLRKALHKNGLRFRLHDRSLPGSPDLVFSKYRAVIFIHGCYWHSHGCYRSTVPKTRSEFWVEKFNANRARDDRNTRLLLDDGWRVFTVWECALKGKSAKLSTAVSETVRKWLESRRKYGELAGASVAAKRQ